METKKVFTAIQNNNLILVDQNNQPISFTYIQKKTPFIYKYIPFNKPTNIVNNQYYEKNNQLTKLKENEITLQKLYFSKKLNKYFMVHGDKIYHSFFDAMNDFTIFNQPNPNIVFDCMLCYIIGIKSNTIEHSIMETNSLFTINI